MHQNRGSAMLWVLLLMAIASSGAYYLNERSEQQLVQQDLKTAGDSAELSNISNLSIVRNLVAFRAPPAARSARDPSSLPLIYPEPYIEVPGRASMLVASAQPHPNVWTQADPSQVTIHGWESRKATERDFDGLFRTGTMPQRTAEKTLSSTIRVARMVRDAGDRITSVEVDADAASKVKVRGLHQTAKSALTTDVTLEPPPPPQCDFTHGLYSDAGNPAGTNVDENAAYDVTIRGYGAFSTATAPNCAPAVPLAAYSARNAGVNVGACRYWANGGNLLGHPINSDPEHPYTYFVTQPRTATVSTPWGASGSCAAPGVVYRRRKPPQCWYTQAQYQAIKTTCVAMEMHTRFAAQGHMYSPSHGWGSQGHNPNGRGVQQRPFCSNGDDNEPLFYPGWAPAWGRVEGSDGQTAECGTSAAIPWRTGVCRFHGIWQWIGTCTSGHNGGFWTSARSFGYVAGGSNWECAAFLYEWPGCVGGPVFVRAVPGCFTPDTTIRMGDGSLKEITKIRGGETVWNPITGRAMPVRRVLAGPEKRDLVRYEVDGGQNRVVTVSEGHAVPTRRGIVKAADLTEWDSVLGGDGVYHPLARLTRLPPSADQVVWNIEIDTDSKDSDDRMLEANGFLVTGDLVLQAEAEGVPVPPMPDVKAELLRDGL